MDILLSTCIIAAEIFTPLLPPSGDMTGKPTARMRTSSPTQELQAILQREICRCESLLDAEDDRSKCKWPMLTMARLLELHKSIQARQGEWQRAACLHCCSLISTMASPAHLWGP